MKIFIDFEFTGLHQNTTPISLGLVVDDDRPVEGLPDYFRRDHEFYAEFNDYDFNQLDPFVRANVLPNLEFGGEYIHPNSGVNIMHLKGNRAKIGIALTYWFVNLADDYPDEIFEIWGDCLAYDWMLFCELFGGALNIPKNVYYIPFDLATLFKVKGIDPDINREEFMKLTGQKHHALHDARVIKACCEKVIGEPE